MEQFRKIAIVTGGSRGLGKNMALSLAKKGLDVILTYNSKKDEAENVVKEIQHLGQKAAILQLDVADVKSFDAFFVQLEHILKETFATDKIEFLVNNAGTGVHAPFSATSEAQFDAMVNVHFKGAFFLTQKLLPIMANGGGIVNISSGLTRFSFHGYAAYASMKGAIETDFGGGAVRDNADLNSRLASMIALGRVGLPDDIGGVVAFLCTDDAKYLNGQRIEVSGGTSL